MSTQLVLSFEPNGATNESLTKHMDSTYSPLVFSSSQAKGCFAKASKSVALSFSKLQGIRAQILQTKQWQMNLRQWGEHQVLTWVHKNCWPETQAALVFSCLLSAEIVDTVIYTAVVSTRGRTSIILWLRRVSSHHSSRNLTDWPTIFLFHRFTDEARQWN